jgi:hypothetical protein
MTSQPVAGGRSGLSRSGCWRDDGCPCDAAQPLWAPFALNTHPMLASRMQTLGGCATRRGMGLPFTPISISLSTNYPYKHRIAACCMSAKARESCSPVPRQGEGDLSRIASRLAFYQSECRLLVTICSLHQLNASAPEAGLPLRTSWLKAVFSATARAKTTMMRAYIAGMSKWE